MKKIFISWSGKLSNEIANILKWWIPTVFRVEDKPFVSSQDIEKGTNWANELSNELNDSEFGIVCVTKSNLNSPWMHFEAGAISKQIKNSSRVCPLLYNVEYNKIKKGPLSQFQATRFEKQDVFKLIESLNESCMEEPKELNFLKLSFEKEWPKLEKKLKQLEKSFPDNNENISSDNDKKILTLLEAQNKSIKEITEKINKIETDYPNLLNMVMDETGFTYNSSIFGNRTSHFSKEKKALARKTVNILENKLLNNKQMKFCLLIDSGTTTFDLFWEISNRIKKVNNKDNKSDDNDAILDIWKNRIFIITNNLPGIQYLIKNCRWETDEYSDLVIKCLLLPGKPLPVYAAVACKETIDFLNEDKISKLMKKELNVENREDYQIISIMSGNYIVRHHDNNKNRELFCPVARGGEDGGHFDIKKTFAYLSDKLYLISPLTKISFATCDSLNNINGYTINEKDDPEGAKKSPEKVMYREIELIDDKLVDKCNFVITRRSSSNIFWRFSQDLQTELKRSYVNSEIHTAVYDVNKIIKELIQNLEVVRDISEDYINYRDLELQIEIPHENLRKAYSDNERRNKDLFIWGHSWIAKTAD